MNADIATFAAGFLIGLILGLTVTVSALGDRHATLPQRELVKHSFAYYTNGPSGYPVFQMKEGVK